LPETPRARDRLIVALDVPSVEAAEAAIARLGESATFYKIGYELAFAGGFDVARRLVGAGKQVFLDLKLHDIGNTVAGGVRSVAGIGATFLTVHAYPSTLRAAVDARGAGPLKILGVTVLTSYDDVDLQQAGYSVGVETLVAHRIADCVEIGADGVVCAPTDLRLVHATAGGRLIAVTPGVRPAGSTVGDQKRIATPGEAIREGAAYIVVGRPILGAADPKAAAEAIVGEISAAAERLPAEPA
jgi:orotidine-5'-phosphate decarboxylase